MRRVRLFLAAAVLLLGVLAPAASRACHEGDDGCPGCKDHCAAEYRGCQVPGSANGLGDTLAPASRLLCG